MRAVAAETRARSRLPKRKLSNSNYPKGLWKPPVYYPGYINSTILKNLISIPPSQWANKGLFNVSVGSKFHKLGNIWRDVRTDYFRIVDGIVKRQIPTAPSTRWTNRLRSYFINKKKTASAIAAQRALNNLAKRTHAWKANVQYTNLPYHQTPYANNASWANYKKYHGI